MAPLILASASPRRRQLLSQIGVEFVVHSVDLDESPLEGELASDYVVRLASAKASLAAVELGSEEGSRVILGADTAVVLDGDILGKPLDRRDALAMLARLSGREHEVATGLAVYADGAIKNALSVTRVKFRALSNDECSAYWRSGEPLDKAGSYAIQGLGAIFVESINGSDSGVVGLPLAETWALLRSAGVAHPLYSDLIPREITL
jgi:septum formation protein